jgi:hypothetical protein
VGLLNKETGVRSIAFSIDCLPDPAWLCLSFNLIVLTLGLDEPTLDGKDHLWRDALEILLVPAQRVS